MGETGCCRKQRILLANLWSPSSCSLLHWTQELTQLICVVAHIPSMYQGSALLGTSASDQLALSRRLTPSTLFESCSVTVFDSIFTKLVKNLCWEVFFLRQDWLVSGKGRRHLEHPQKSPYIEHYSQEAY